MAEWLVIFLLPFAAWSGWWVAMRRDARIMRQERSRTAYFDGLSCLLNDQTDKAVDIFVAIAEFDHQTVENQLTLGRLFRKRGEVDRALHLHKQLEQQASPDSVQMADILFELAEDYRFAGMYAEAQSRYELLLEKRPQKRVMSVLLRLYERTGDWVKARALAKRWQDSGYGDQSVALANYDCECAIIAHGEGDLCRATELLSQALIHDPHCIRANALLGQYALEEGAFIQALCALQSIEHQSIAYLADVLPLMSRAYQALARIEEYQQWLWQLGEKNKDPRLLIAITEAFNEIGAVNDAEQFLTQSLHRTHNPLLIWICLQQGIDLFLNSEEMMKAVKPQAIYQCDTCGFRQQKQSWHCPACFSWGGFIPALELKVEQK